MDKRSWPWRRKTTDRSVSPNESFDSSSIQTSSRHIDYQDLSSIVPDKSRVTDDGWQDYEEKIKVLNDKLYAALMDVTGKELLARQHAKLAEEAVSGWETVEAEAAFMKQQLEITIQQKLATEDRVSHLDGALKECMKQLRDVREEQEENIHNAIVKKTREWDRLRCELEDKMADLEQTFLEKDAENKAMSRSLGERARTISQISETCAKAQAEVSMLRAHLESSEKEKVALKYELSVAHKEIEIRNEEKGLSKRAADAASKQHSEDVKKIAKLEAECQRLRSLIRQKLPGPAAIAQMRLEAEGPWIEKADGRKKSGKGNLSPRDLAMQSMQAFTIEDNHQAKEEGLWSDRFSSLEEETKMLREILAKRNNELQSARLMCVRTASKLSAVEHQLEALDSHQGKQRVPVVSGLEIQLESCLSNTGEPSLASVSEDGNDGEVSCAESWATALIAELDQFKKEKLMPATGTATLTFKSETDDFTEMEQLVGLSPCNEPNSKEQTFREQQDEALTGDSSTCVQKGARNLLKEVESQDACKRCEEFCARLAAAEEDLAKRAIDQTCLAELKRKLTLFFEEGACVNELWEKLRADIELPESFSKDCLSDRSSTLPTATRSLLAIQDDLCCSLDPNSTLHGVVSELTTAVSQLVSFVKDFAVASNTEDQSPASTTSLSTGDADEAHIASSDRKLDLPDDVHLKTDELDQEYYKLSQMNSHSIDGKVDLLQFMMQLSSVVSHIARVKHTRTSTTRSSSRKALSFKSSAHTSGEMDFIGLGSPMSDTSKSECSEAAAKIVPADESVQSFRKDCFSSEVLRLEEELRKAQAERVSLETHMKADYRRFSDIEEELFQLKLVKGELETCVTKNQEEIQQLRAEKYEAEHRLGSLETELNSAESSKQRGEQQLNDMAAAKDEAELQLRACKSELGNLHQELNALGEELFHKEEKNLELEARCKRLQDELEIKSNLSCPKCARDAAKDEQICRELEIAAASEKLAECERTILVLGQQLKALAFPKSLDSFQAIQNSLSLSHASLGSPHGSSSRYLSTSHDNALEASGRAQFSEHQEFIAKKNVGGLEKDSPWDPRASIASDILDSELISLAMPGQASGRKMYDMFGDRVPVHEDYIEAVAQMPSSPEAEFISPKRVASRPPRRKKRSPQSFGDVDISKSMNDACSPSAEKHGSSFSRFFSRTKSSR